MVEFSFSGCLSEPINRITHNVQRRGKGRAVQEGNGAKRIHTHFGVVHLADYRRSDPLLALTRRTILNYLEKGENP